MVTMSAPDGEAASPAFLVMALGRRVREQTDAELKDDGLSLRHVSALGHLARRPGLSYSELARRAGITVQSMQATLLQLEELGAVERRTEPGRGRTAQLHVTEAGTVLLDRARAVVRAADARLLAGTDAEQREQIRGWLLRAFTATLPAGSPPRGDDG